MREILWQSGSDGEINSQVGIYRLTVLTFGGLVRYLVRDCRNANANEYDGPLVTSGTRPSIGAAMAAAEATASRLAPAPSFETGITRATAYNYDPVDPYRNSLFRRTEGNQDIIHISRHR